MTQCGLVQCSGPVVFHSVPPCVVVVGEKGLLNLKKVCTGDFLKML